MVAASTVAVASVAVLVASGVVTAGAARLVRHTQDVPSSVVASACTDDEDCELLGSCRGGVCVCSAGFIGPTCGQLNLAPADATTRGRVWPLTSQPAATGQIAWSFAPVYDPVSTRVVRAHDRVRCMRMLLFLYCLNARMNLSVWFIQSDFSTWLFLGSFCMHGNVTLDVNRVDNVARVVSIAHTCVEDEGAILRCDMCTTIKFLLSLAARAHSPHTPCPSCLRALARRSHTSTTPWWR